MYAMRNIPNNAAKVISSTADKLDSLSAVAGTMKNDAADIGKLKALLGEFVQASSRTQTRDLDQQIQQEVAALVEGLSGDCQSLDIDILHAQLVEFLRTSSRSRARDLNQQIQQQLAALVEAPSESAEERDVSDLSC
jgi:hypothetical protein